LQLRNNGQQFQVLNAQNQEAIRTQALESTPNIETFAAPINSTRCDGQYLDIPKAESSNNDREVCFSYPIGCYSERHLLRFLNFQGSFISHNSGCRSCNKTSARKA
jgi:hypothetical protein